MNSNKRAPKSLPTCGTIRGARGLQVQLKNGLAGTKRYADLSAGDAPIAYQSSHRFIPRGSAQADAKLKRTGDVGQQPQRRPAGPSRSRSVCWPSAAAAPPSRPEPVKQVGLLAERAGIGAASRARDHSTLG